MYSGTTLTKASGRIMGAHQKIDRLARRNLTPLLRDTHEFPTGARIIQFEGRNGPDGIKVKSPAQDEPWHYIDPFDPNDRQLLGLIDDHYKSLIKELRQRNTEKVAFEAAWLAHAIVDGLTPAHHYPYEEKLIELRGGQGIESRTTIKEKLIMHGDTRLEKARNNWKMWGTKGLMTTHTTFELGVASLIKPLGMKESAPSQTDLQAIKELGISEVFLRTAKEIAVAGMYENYYKKGWTPRLAWQVRHLLGPAMVRTVTLAWYAAADEAGLTKS